jgi:hypothetical protein
VATLRRCGNVTPLWQRYTVASQHIKKKEKEILVKYVVQRHNAVSAAA